MEGILNIIKKKNTINGKFNINIDEKGDVTERCTICNQIFKHYEKNIEFITLKDQK